MLLLQSWRKPAVDPRVSCGVYVSRACCDRGLGFSVSGVVPAWAAFLMSVMVTIGVPVHVVCRYPLHAARLARMLIRSASLRSEFDVFY